MSAICRRSPTTALGKSGETSATQSFAARDTMRRPALRSTWLLSGGTRPKPACYRGRLRRSPARAHDRWWRLGAVVVNRLESVLIQSEFSSSLGLP